MYTIINYLKCVFCNVCVVLCLLMQIVFANKAVAVEMYAVNAPSSVHFLVHREHPVSEHACLRFHELQLERFLYIRRQENPLPDRARFGSLRNEANSSTGNLRTKNLRGLNIPALLLSSELAVLTPSKYALDLNQGPRRSKKDLSGENCPRFWGCFSSILKDGPLGGRCLSPS